MVPVTEQETILVVDDAPATLEVLERNLQARGYRVFTAPGAEPALRMVLESWWGTARGFTVTTRR